MQSVWEEPRVNMGPQFNFAWSPAYGVIEPWCSASLVADEALDRKTSHRKSLNYRGLETTVCVLEALYFILNTLSSFCATYIL